MVQETNDRNAGEAAMEKPDLAGLSDAEITQPYQFASIGFHAPELSQLQAMERANFSTY